MPRRRLRREPVNDPGGLETIFESSEEEEEDDNSSKTFVLGRNARKRALKSTDPWSKDKVRQRKKMMKKHEKPLNLNPLTPGREADLIQLLNRGLSVTKEEDEEGEEKLLLPLLGMTRGDSSRPELKCMRNVVLSESRCNSSPQETTTDSHPRPSTKTPPSEFLKEIEEADALLGPLPFLTSVERVNEVRTIRKSSRFLAKCSSSNKENVCGSIFEEKEVRVKKRRSTFRISSASTLTK